LAKIADPLYAEWAAELHKRWKMLCRKIRDAYKDPAKSSLIAVDQSFIVPGGRFREFYYWVGNEDDFKFKKNNSKNSSFKKQEISQKAN
jgi:hypothetical protein